MFQYIEKPSFIHSLNPMIKFLGITIAVLILTLLFRPLPTLFMALLALFMLLVLARIPPGALLKSTVPFWVWLLALPGSTSPSRATTTRR